jgi:hypothetical protein
VDAKISKSSPSVPIQAPETPEPKSTPVDKPDSPWAKDQFESYRKSSLDDMLNHGAANLGNAAVGYGFGGAGAAGAPGAADLGNAAVGYGFGGAGAAGAPGAADLGNAAVGYGFGGAGAGDLAKTAVGYGTGLDSPELKTGE